MIDKYWPDNHDLQKEILLSDKNWIESKGLEEKMINLIPL
jgi:hypothetical protein